MFWKKEKLNLPQEYINFLNLKEKLDLRGLKDYDDVEDIEPLPLQKLKTNVLKYTTYLLGEFFEDYKWDLDEGYFTIEYIDLLNGDDRNLLVWYPQLQCFGQFDSEHGAIYAYKNVPWHKIQKKPENFLSGIYEHNLDEKYELDPRKEKLLEFIVTGKKENKTTAPEKTARSIDTLRLEIEYDPYEKKQLFILNEKEDASDEPLIILACNNFEIEYTIKKGVKTYESGRRVVLIDSETGKPGYVKSTNAFYNAYSGFAIAPLNKKDLNGSPLKEYFPTIFLLDNGIKCQLMINHVLQRMQTGKKKLTVYNVSDFLGIGENDNKNEKIFDLLDNGMRTRDPRPGITRKYTLRNVMDHREYHAYTDSLNNIYKFIKQNEILLDQSIWFALSLYDEQRECYTVTPKIIGKQQRVVAAWNYNDQVPEIYRRFEPKVQFVVEDIKEGKFKI